LLEVLIAFAIAAPALAVLYQGGVASLRSAGTASRYGEAIERAQSHLAMLAAADLVPGERSGDEGRGFHWQTRIEPVATAAPAPAPRGPYAGGFTLYALTVQVSWHGAARSRVVSLATRRIGPATATPP
jgi:general secretion pathway protein I